MNYNLWIFADFKLPTKEEMDLLDSLNITDVVLGVEVEPRAWKLKYPESRIIKTAKELHNRGLKTHLMCWLSRNRKDIIQTAQGMLQLANSTGCRSMLLDAEYHWHKGGNISSGEASRLVLEHFANRPCQLGVTGLGKLRLSMRNLLKACDYGIPQAYSIWKPGTEKHWSHSRSTEPGQLQLAAYESWGVCNKPLIMGLSCYWAERPPRYGLPKMNQMNSMYLSFNSSETTSFAYWSLKHLHGSTKADQRADFIRAIRKPGNITSVLAAQELLVDIGYDLGNYGPLQNGVDGKWGKKSKAALDSFKAVYGVLNSLYLLSFILS